MILSAQTSITVSVDVVSSSSEVSCTAWVIVNLCAQAYVRANTFSMDSLLPENHEFWRIDAMPLHFLLEHRHSNPSRDEACRVHVNVLLQFSRGHITDDASRLCSLHHCMHWSWSAKILHNLKKFRLDIPMKTVNCKWQESRGNREKEINHPLYIHQGASDKNMRCVFSCSGKHALNRGIIQL